MVEDNQKKGAAAIGVKKWRRFLKEEVVEGLESERSKSSSNCSIEILNYKKVELIIVHLINPIIIAIVKYNEEALRVKEENKSHFEKSKKEGSMK